MQGKKANQQMYLNLAVLQRCNLPFCCQGHLKHFLENYVFCRKFGNDTYSRRWGACYLRHYDALRTKIDM